MSRDFPQPKVGKNYSYFSNLKPNIRKPCCLNTLFIPNNSDLIAYKTDRNDQLCLVSKKFESVKYQCSH